VFLYRLKAGKTPVRRFISMSFFFNSRKPAPFAKLALFGALVAAPALFFASSIPSYAQSATSGALSGTISDASGALLPGTIVTIKSIETGTVKTVKSNARGEYRVDSLTPGAYTVSFAADGFEGYQADAVAITVGNVSSLSPKLKTGSVNDKVVVTDDAPQLHTQDNAISTTIDQNAIDNLPINGRRWSDFALLTPGVVSNSDGFGLLSFRGISYLLNNSTVDGADDNQAYFSEARGRTRSSYTVTQGAVQEFQVNTSNYSAEYGRAAGGVINTVTKSGGNKTHGEVFFYDRDNSLGGASNPYTQIYNFDENTGIHPQNVKPKDRRLQFGFGVGGALIKDKLFWFYAYDQSRRSFPGIARTTDPYDLFALAGPQTGKEACAGSTTTYGPTDFGAPYITYTTPTGNTIGPVTITSNLSTPTLTGTASNSSAYPIGQAYQGNFGACALAAALNPPTGTGAVGTLNYQQAAAYYNQGLGVLASFFGQVDRFQNQSINFPKLDYQINDRNRMTVQYNRLRDDSPNGVQTQTSNFYGRGSYGNDFVKADVGIFRLSTVLTNSVVNTFLASYGRDMETEFPSGTLPNEQPLVNALSLGECSAPRGGCPAGAPDLSVGYGYDAAGFDAGTSALFSRFALPDERRLQLKDDVTMSHSKHTFKFGLDYNKVSDYINNLYNGYGTYDFDWAYSFVGDYLHKTTGLGGAGYAGATFTNDGACTSGQYCEANFGLYSSYSQGYTVPSNYNATLNTGTADNVGAKSLMATREYAGYATDDWRVTSRLTLTLGVRYEYEYVPGNPTPNPDLNGSNSIFAAKNLHPNTYTKPDDRNNYGPRLGFSLNIFGDNKTILRGGYGIYYGRIINANIEQSYQNSGGPGSQVNISGIFPDATIADQGVCKLLFPNIIPTYTQAISCALQTNNASSHPSVSYLDSKLENPLVHEADLAIEQDLGHGFVFGLTYMGSYGRELDRAVDMNIDTSLQYQAHYTVNNTAGPAIQNPILPHGGKPAPFKNGSVLTVNTYGTSVNAAGVVTARSNGRYDSNYYRVLDIVSNVNSNYNAFAVSLNKRYKAGFSLLANYTWSHSMDDNPYIGTGIPSDAELDPARPQEEHGNSSLNVPNRFVAALTYQPPTHFHGLKDAALGGWRIAPIFQEQNGLAYTPYISGYPGESVSGIRSANGDGNTSGRIEELERNQYTRPKTTKLDMRVGKNFYFNVDKFGLDRVRFEVFAEVFNVMNHQNITGIQNTAYNLSYAAAAAVGSNISTVQDTLTLQPNFGTYNNSNSNFTYTPRQLQLAARLHF
jgi:hypothetical protein